MKTLLMAMLCALLTTPFALAQTRNVQDILQTQRALIEESSRRTIGPAIDALADSGLPAIPRVLETWQAKEMWQRAADGLFFAGEETADGLYRLIDFDTGAPVGTYPRSELTQLKPNSGIRALIATALVRFQLTDPDPAKRSAALDSLGRDPEAGLLEPLRASVAAETDPALRARKERMERLMTIAHGASPAERIAAIESLSGDLGVDFRATLNPILATRRTVIGATDPPPANVAATLSPGGEELGVTAAYDLLVAEGRAPALVTKEARDAALTAHIRDGEVGGLPVAALSSETARDTAYDALVVAGLAEPRVGPQDVAEALAGHRFLDVYADPDPDVTAAAAAALGASQTRVAVGQAVDLGLDALSLASIYFLAAIGLAITFGVMGVINMAHGEFIMMGAYTGFVVQQFVTNHTASILLAVPLAFAVTFAAGVALERLVIRWLYHRPLETLLATFGVSIALQQLAKNIFGTQARPLTAPGWLDGAWVINDVVAISYIRIAIFALALLFLGLFLFIMNRTRLGLETRAVTQNPRMAASMGINPDRVNMLTFGLGSGIAGIAGVVIGLFAKVTSEMGGDYIVQSFMTVVVGGVGNIWGTLAGATMIGGFQKGVEWLNPSNTLAAQTYMIVFIIIFIQFRPRGIIALKGRAAGD
ncbi:branched-chain amino acid ABC transporter, permease protein [Oceanicola granulosus HTCC2516]|uniref:Branched-chain amino acid ABC transporter, permease protein n=1 Tax=Oceanicola granulosus (strain ATCC BAA-861 / DSM 15982 / KCTC 12143 / HTCC2516) TaxID=314256 RepID=Q2CJ33_OCEGH|nr:urea ABC transporter permease subunit UrtB [Oceanicola granulosus]EAR52767.1 branched-chain amino acid ABC transporter, permease protein [Oceanicola granulosus HTCC2516]